MQEERGHDNLHTLIRYPGVTSIRDKHETSEGIGKKVYLAGSDRMWWRPLQAPDRVPSARTHGRYSQDGHGGKHVLVVEDESYLCDLIADVLEAEGHHPRLAGNGREALETLRDFTPDLILLDLMMPVMDGWEVMNSLRSDPKLADIPVVIITAIYDLKRTQTETGASAVLTKPFDIDQLAQVVDIYAR
jgi:CheY-like chemotaxis protein